MTTDKDKAFPAAETPSTEQPNPSLTDGFMDAVKSGPEALSTFIRAAFHDPAAREKAFETMGQTARDFDAARRDVERKKAAAEEAEQRLRDAMPVEKRKGGRPPYAGLPPGDKGKKLSAQFATADATEVQHKAEVEGTTSAVILRRLALKGLDLERQNG